MMRDIPYPTSRLPSVQPRQNRDRVAAKAPQILGKVDRYQGAHDVDIFTRLGSVLQSVG